MIDEQNTPQSEENSVLILKREISRHFIESVTIVLAFLSLLVLPITLSRISQNILIPGLAPKVVVLIPILIIIPIFIVCLLRKRLNDQLLILHSISIFSVLCVGEFLLFGLFSAGLLFLVIAIFITTVMLGLRAGIICIGVHGVLIIIISYLWTSGSLLLPGDANEIIMQPLLWAYGFLITIVTATIFFILIPRAMTGLSELIDTVDQQKKKIEYLASHDALTGLPTLRLALDRLEISINNAKRTKQKVALVSLDLDGFKQVNDTYGHEAGDIVLQSVAKRLLGVIREGDTACRMGGDEFMLLLNNIVKSDVVEQICHRLIASVGKTVIYKDVDLVVGVSVGVAMYPDHAVDSVSLRKVSDDVMYKVKKSGKNNYMFADS